MRSLGKSFLIYGLASGLSKSLTILLVPIYTKLFTTTEYAVIDLITSLFFLIAVIALLQLESALSRYYYEVDSKALKFYIGSTLVFVTLVSGVFTCICVASAKIISNLLFDTSAHSNAIV